LHSISYINQKVVEIIVINDGSTVDYSDIISNSGELITKYITVENPMGVSNARNTGISNSSGEWVLFLDDDDEIAPDYVESLISCISEVEQSVGFIWGNVELHKYKKKSVKVTEMLFTYSSDKELAFQASKIGASYGLAVRRNLLNQLGAFDTKFTVGEDTELIIRFLSFDIKPFHINLVAIKKHDHVGTRLTSNYIKYSNSLVYEEILTRYETYLKSNRLILKNIIKWSFYVHIISGNFKHSLGVIRAANMNNIGIVALVKSFLIFSWFTVKK
jgi:glycosyltransferase involved in cell wall biosynthesis